MQSKLNEDFQWHVFFMMIFLLRCGSNIEDFDDYIQVYYRLIVQPSWLKHAFTSLSEEDAFEVRNSLEEMMADAIVYHDTISMVYEQTMYRLMNCFETVVNEVEQKYRSIMDFRKDEKKIAGRLSMLVYEIFAK